MKRLFDAEITVMLACAVKVLYEGFWHETSIIDIFGLKVYQSVASIAARWATRSQSSSSYTLCIATPHIVYQIKEIFHKETKACEG